MFQAQTLLLCACVAPLLAHEIWPLPAGEHVDAPLPACNASNSSSVFVHNLNGFQVDGLAPVKGCTAVGCCIAACCAIPTCQVWELPPATQPAKGGCWVGRYNPNKVSKARGFLSAARGDIPPPNPGPSPGPTPPPGPPPPPGAPHVVDSTPGPQQPPPTHPPLPSPARLRYQTRWRAQSSLLTLGPASHRTNIQSEHTRALVSQASACGGKVSVPFQGAGRRQSS